MGVWPLCLKRGHFIHSFHRSGILSSRNSAISFRYQRPQSGLRQFIAMVTRKDGRHRTGVHGIGGCSYAKRWSSCENSTGPTYRGQVSFFFSFFKAFLKLLFMELQLYQNAIVMLKITWTSYSKIQRALRERESKHLRYYPQTINFVACCIIFFAVLYLKENVLSKMSLVFKKLSHYKKPCISSIAWLYMTNP